MSEHPHEESQRFGAATVAFESSETEGVEIVRIELLPDDNAPPIRRWHAAFRRR